MFWAEKIDQNEFFYSKELLLNFSVTNDDCNLL